MEQIKNQSKLYSIVKASAEQRDYIYNNFYHRESVFNAEAVFTAVDEHGKIIGHIIAVSSNNAPDSWFIVSIKVQREYRRQGIGTALFLELQNLSIENNINDLHCYANPTEEASEFWKHMGFCITKFGRVVNEGDHNLIDSFGNYSHLMFKNPNKMGNIPASYISDISLVKTTRNQIDYIFDNYLHLFNQTYFEQVKNDLFGFVALDHDNQIVGFSLMKHEPLYPPFNEMQLVFWIYVKPEMRRKGIGTALANEVIAYAQSRNPHHLFHAGKDDELPFWKYLNFHVHIQGKSSDDPTKSVIYAGMRI